jgi:hypothetical protein
MRREKLYDPYCAGWFHFCARIFRALGSAFAGSSVQRTLTDRHVELWYPVPPRFTILLRLLGLALGWYVVVHHDSYPLWGAAIVPVWLLTIVPEPRPRTAFYRLGVVAHWLLIATCGAIGVAFLAHPLLARWSVSVGLYSLHQHFHIAL